MRKRIPVSGEEIPAIGLGTWQAFDVAPGSPASASRVEVLREFLARGGTLVDSSPMYGLAESAKTNAVRRGGYPTTVMLNPKKPRTVNYIIGVAAIPLGATGKILNRLFQQTFAVAKQVRTDTAIGASPVPNPSAMKWAGWAKAKFREGRRIMRSDRNPCATWQRAHPGRRAISPRDLPVPRRR